MKIIICGVLLGVLFLAGRSQPKAEAQTQSGGTGTIEAINHTKWAINHFSVNGQSGIDAIGPFDGSGGGCCYGTPTVWKPGMTVRIDWETGVGSSDDFPGYEDEKKFLEWAKKIKDQHRQHSKTVPLPDYTGQETCGITVHFLPCNDVKVTTSCFTYGSPSYPIKLPLEMKEPKVCPK
ncbi:MULTISPECIES: DUF3304 domain-containing protein [Enterobacter]|uniref:DUF3304 domain-containing protein n=1 Tax=Enterobacter TaxID=547 RepID=UPI000C1E85D5|nr:MULTISPECIES: DUF3304 domain-containing protein [Enterobacter]ELE9689216.1 DUF3304 domain-containing protein [Enterobacter kobei]MBO4153325.1 DUF3304 domain-containing protein [Enterobacter kobei]MCK7112133.1 DUF3304 domain-containing protein [Enterobacter kobei]MCK7154037.1 DUF3304 domain-containing protein [Enterobacter kobei]MCK7215026.1 DUF3304 domain-containing protein [Enterobacter kobei]